mmetsp:Transcript_50339/g.79753  ORF Transcript_50339/g.79753 Transcript_50339/m.79753 type:complete len:1647 (-) Transcript_50339:116-5056(-)|eukprot:CAMPEP_0169079026 /NCGR_PEP_ID=MMETSP1015-20121227/9722_1 /TAXON_ID=342587 /ORGANISM="Karlodinium micrum, Strain CCMP2283" /LENGTH=1646 /DNA_ID=CAMNT_0009138649 /DNA_START=119 /DNA_END=5059 /DNA_ORIENTATION=-
MPGGGLYKRVAQATATSREGPEILLRSPGEKEASKTQVVAAEDNQSDEQVQEEVCEVKAFTVWYWTDGPEPTFVPETLYMNSKEMGHKSGEPRLIVSLSSFEALSNAYVMAVEKEGIKAGLLQEKEDLLQELRVGYYKELQHLRELLGMAKEQMALARQRTLEDHERKRMEEFERQVRETDVHYFNIVDYLEPELKGIMKDAVKQFNRHLMLENFSLKDMLALYEGSNGDAGLPERLISLLMSKGTTPAQIVKILGGMISDNKEMSESFYDACRDVLGVSKTTLQKEEVPAKRKPNELKNSGRKNLSVEEDGSPTGSDGGRKPSNSKAFQDAKDEAERLREELAKLKAAMEEEMRKRDQENAEMARKLEAAQKQAADAEKALKEAERKLEKALDDVKQCKKELALARGRTESDEFTPGGSRREPDSPTRKAAVNQKDLDDARRKAEEAERKLAELEARLREANQKIAKLTDSVADMEEKLKEARKNANRGDIGGTASNDDESGNDSPGQFTPGGTRKKGRVKPEGDFTKSASGLDVRNPNRNRGKKMTFIDRDYSGIDRSGDYSALLGKPMSVVEEELARERKMRINLEIETKKMQDELSDLSKEKKKLDDQCHKYEHELQESRQRLKQLIEEDESDGVNDVQIFCRWLIRRYGNLENGFRAMDSNKSGGMSVYEFNAGLMQMGWIKIVGRRLFKIIDAHEKGEIELSDLEAVFNRFVEGREDDEDIAESLRKAEEESKAMEKDQLGEARERIRKLVVENNDLEKENKRLKDLSSKMEMRAVGSKDGGQGMKNMERKVDLMKEGYDKLKQERDENASKMTAAMWKCREAHILQVKYMRQAEQAEQDLKKLQRKYDMVKKSFRKRDSGMFEEGNASVSVAAMSTALLSNPGLMTGFINSVSLEVDPDDEPKTVRLDTPGSPSSIKPSTPSEKLNTPGERLGTTDTASITLSPSSTSVAFRPGTGSPPPSSYGLRRTSTGCSSPSGLLCPKCGTALRVRAPTQESFNNTQSSTPGALKQLLAAAANMGPGSGDELGTEGEESGGGEMSPEDVIANMTDEDLLFGHPRGLKPLRLGTAHKGGASYRDKIEAQANQPGKKRRWQLLFADAQEKQNEAEQGMNASVSAMGTSVRGMGTGIGGIAVRPTTAGLDTGASPMMLSKESMNLLEHAKQVREKSLWKEASINEVGPGNFQSMDLRGEPLSPTIGGQGTARAFGIGGAPVSQSFAGGTRGRVALGSSMRGMPDIPEPKAFSMANLGSISSQSMATSASAPMLRAQARLVTTPPPPHLEESRSPKKEGKEGLPAAVANLLQPSEAQRSQRPHKKPQRETSPPERTPLPGPPLQIIGNEKIESQGYLTAGDHPLAKDETDKGSITENSSPTRPLNRMSSTSLGEGGVLASHMPFDNDDDGTQPWHHMSHGNKNVVGMWTGGVRSLGRGRIDHDHAFSQALGAGLPGDVSRSPIVLKAGLRRVPAQLPQIGKTKLDKLSSSMPDLNIHERPAIIKTHPLVASVSPGSEVSSPVLQRSRKSPRSRRQSAPEDSSCLASFEALGLYIGRPPPVGHVGPHEASLRESHGTGASHTVPSALKKQFAMAANALELGIHVQRHAAVEQDLGEDFQSPLIVSHCITPMPFEGDAPRVNATSGRVLLS